MTNEVKEKDVRSYSSTIKLLIVVALAFVAAVTFRRSAGILAMTPVSLLICALAAFIGISILTKCTVFGITVFTVNTIENDDINVTIMFTALCLLAVFVLSIAAKQIKSGKKYGYAVMVAGVAVCIGLNLFFIGNPFKALDAKDTITEYTDKKYPESENAQLGSFEFSRIYFRHDTKAYVIDAASDKFPTEKASVTLGNEVLADGFEEIMEDKLGEPYVLEIKEFLREKFPDDSFSVELDGFALLPEENAFSSKEGALYGNVRYEIYLGGVQTNAQMQERVEEYVKAIDESGIGYANIVFKSGIGNWQRRYVSIDPNHKKNGFEFEIEYVSKDTSNRFNKYLSEVIFD